MAKCSTCGGQKTIILPADKTPLGVAAEVDCPECKGAGEVGNPDVCPTCNGRKTVILPADRSPVGFAVEVDCPECNPLRIVRPR